MPKWVIVGSVALAVSTAFAGGFVLGRLFPAHRYEHFPDGRLLFDTTTGKVCTPFQPEPESKPAEKPEAEKDPKDLSFLYPKPVPKPIPQCGSE